MRTPQPPPTPKTGTLKHAIFALYCSIQLQEIDKQKLRELASQARADSAKRAQKTTEQFPSADGVCFGAPVKVR